MFKLCHHPLATQSSFPFLCKVSVLVEVQWAEVKKLEYILLSIVYSLMWSFPLYLSASSMLKQCHHPLATLLSLPFLCSLSILVEVRWKEQEEQWFILLSIVYSPMRSFLLYPSTLCSVHVAAHYVLMHLFSSFIGEESELPTRRGGWPSGSCGILPTALAAGGGKPQLAPLLP